MEYKNIIRKLKQIKHLIMHKIHIYYILFMYMCIINMNSVYYEVYFVYWIRVSQSMILMVQNNLHCLVQVQMKSPARLSPGWILMQIEHTPIWARRGRHGSIYFCCGVETGKPVSTLPALAASLQQVTFHLHINTNIPRSFIDHFKKLCAFQVCIVLFVLTLIHQMAFCELFRSLILLFFVQKDQNPKGELVPTFN